jgi:hypothetical protein
MSLLRPQRAPLSDHDPLDAAIGQNYAQVVRVQGLGIVDNR